MVDFVPGRWDGETFSTSVGSTRWQSHIRSEGVLEAMVRPDCVNCCPSAEGNGVIVEREFRGAFYLYWIALDCGVTIRSLLSHIDEYEVGARVSAQVRCGHSLRPFVDGLAIEV